MGTLCWIAYRLRTVATPIVIAAAIAYILNPVVTYFERRRSISRLTTVIIAFVMLGLVVLGGGFYLGSKTVVQAVRFQQNLDEHVATVGSWITTIETRISGTTTAPADGQAASPATAPTAAGRDWWQTVAPVIKRHGTTIAQGIQNTFAAVLSNFFSFISLAVLIPLFTFFFLWRFNDMVAFIHDHLPATYRPNIAHVARTIDSAMANFFRGRLIVCVVVGTLTGIGWTVVGVGPGMPLGLFAGVLNLVPFLSIAALPPALLFAYLDGGSAWMLGGVFLVYIAVQGIETFVLSPAIEGRTSGLHPMVIVIAIMVGAELAGLLGMLLAIPVTSTLRTLSAELLMPEIRRLARPDEDNSESDENSTSEPPEAAPTAGGPPGTPADRTPGRAE